MSEPAQQLGDPAADRDVSALAERFRTLADTDYAGYSPTYERIARALAAEPDTLALLAGVAPTGRTPVLSFAAVHDIVLAEPDQPLAAIYAGDRREDPWPAYRALLQARSGDVAERMRTRAIQTNEVGRSAAIAPALAAVAADEATHRGRRLALVEVGASAGLNLLFDRYAATYRREGAVVGRCGPTDSAVQLDCELRGPADPPFGPAPDIASRRGLDLKPVDVTDDESCRWLRACLWPDVPDRAQRLTAAVAVARRSPPPLHRGDARTDLAPLLAELPDDVLPVVLATWALAYLGRTGRDLLLEALDDLGARRDLVLVTAEEASATPWLPEPPAEVAACGDGAGAGTPTLLGRRTWRDGTAADEALALSHPHVRWMAWVPGAGATA